MQIHGFLVDDMIPELFSRTSRDGRDDAPAGEDGLGFPIGPTRFAGTVHQILGIGKNGKLRDQVRQTVAIDIGCAGLTDNPPEAGPLPGRRRARGSGPPVPSAFAVYVHRSDPSCARQGQERG